MEYSYNTLLISCVLILVSSGSLSIDWLFSLWVMFSCCFACLIIFKKVFICFYSAAPGPRCGVGILSCGVEILSCSMWDLVLWPGVQPGPPALGAWSHSCWTTREFPCRIIFDWVPGMVNFTLLGVGYFFISTDILELCSEMQLNYLERLWGKILLFLCNIPWILGFPGLAVGRRTVFGSVWALFP